MESKKKQEITQQLFIYFYENHSIVLMDDDFEKLFDVINYASKNCLSWELRKREMQNWYRIKNVVDTRQSENHKHPDKHKKRS